MVGYASDQSFDSPLRLGPTLTHPTTLSATSHHVAHHHLAFRRRALVKFRIHPAFDAFALERFGELLADIRILLMVRDRAAALAQIDSAIVHELLARAARPPRTLIVRAVPRRDAQTFFADPEMLMEPVARHRRRRDKTDRLVVLAQDLVGLAILPGRRAERFWPRVGVAPAFDADEHRCRLMFVRLGITAGLVLADPDIEAVVGHLRLDAAIARRAAVVERQLGIDDVGYEIG